MKNNNKNIALITEGFGHGFISALIARVNNIIPVAFSTKETEEDFNNEVNQIHRNLCFALPEMRKATWEEREELLTDGWNIRQSLLAGEISAEMWKKVAEHKLTPEVAPNSPKFAGMPCDSVMFVPQKLQTDGQCGVSAAQQSLSPDLFGFLKECGYGLVLGQHFNKVNDLEKVQALSADFNLYVPGMTEDEEVFGIRGVQHEKYWNLYKRLKGCVGIAGTHTWYLLTTRPEVPQIILFNKKGVERWTEIQAAYQAAGYPIFCFGFDEQTDLKDLMEEVEETFNLFL